MWFVVKVVDGKERRVISRHWKKECARKAALKLRCGSGIMGLRVVYKGLPVEENHDDAGKGD